MADVVRLDAIRTKPSTKEYRDGFERIFGEKAAKQRSTQEPVPYVRQRCTCKHNTRCHECEHD